MTGRPAPSLPARALRALKSRRLAVWLIATLGVYSFLGTLVPQGSLADAEVARWAAEHSAAEAVVRLLGFHAAYSTPVFLMLVGVLTVSMGLCAWERTAAAIRDLRGIGTASPSRLERLRRAPGRPIADGVSDPLEVATRALRRPGTVVKSGPRLAHVVTGAWGPVGSAAFHVCLVLLLATIGVGRLSRAEGFAGAVVGGPESSLAVSKLKQGEAGLLHTDRDGGLAVRVTRFSTDYRAGGVRYHETPYVELVRGDQVLAGQWVRPNAPLRYGSLLIHRSGYGFGVVLTASDAKSTSNATEVFLLDFDPAAPGGVKTGGLSVSLSPDSPATEASVTVALPVGKGRLVPVLAKDPRAIVTVRSAMASAPLELSLGVGQSADLPGGIRLKVDRIAYYARLSVVDDPSVYPIYGLFALAAVALSVSLLTPMGQAWFMLVGDGPDSTLRVLISARRAGPAFEERVGRAVRAVTVAGPYDEEEA